MRRSTRLAWLPFVIGLLALAGSTSGCATITGTITGPFTGFVDLPAEVYRHHGDVLDAEPLLWTPNALVLAPIGFAAGPAIGFVKGVALDVQWLVDRRSYREVFGTYRRPSIWRPWTVRW